MSAIIIFPLKTPPCFEKTFKRIAGYHVGYENSSVIFYYHFLSIEKLFDKSNRK